MQLFKNDPPQLRLIDPSKVTVWPGNPRNLESLEGRVEPEFIESIGAGQKVPVVVRPVFGMPGVEFELIAGCRRLYAANWIQVNQCPQIQLLAMVSEMSDKDAFALTDAENRARKDISDYERAQSYDWALKHIYDGSLTDLTEALGISKSWASRILSVSKMPDVIVDAFGGPDRVELKPGHAVMAAMKHSSSEVIRKAEEIAAEQRDRALNCSELIPPARVARTLVEAAATGQPVPPRVWRGASGTPIMTIKGNTRDDLTIQVHKHSGASRDDLHAIFDEALNEIGDPK